MESHAVGADRPVRPGSAEIDGGVATRGHGYPALAGALAAPPDLPRCSSDIPSARLRLVLLIPPSLRTMRRAIRAAMTMRTKQVAATYRNAPQSPPGAPTALSPKANA